MTLLFRFKTTNYSKQKSELYFQRYGRKTPPSYHLAPHLRPLILSCSFNSMIFEEMRDWVVSVTESIHIISTSNSSNPIQKKGCISAVPLVHTSSAKLEQIQGLVSLARDLKQKIKRHILLISKQPFDFPINVLFSDILKLDEPPMNQADRSSCRNFDFPFSECLRIFSATRSALYSISKKRFIPFFI